jgi:hypothetical protein
MTTIIDGENPRVEEISHAFQFHMWLHVLASPRVFYQMTRKPTREHMLSVYARYLPYAQSRRARVDQQGYFVTRGDEELREKLSNRIRELFETWNPPDLPKELTDAARALLAAECIEPPECGWDNVQVDPNYPPEECLLWPEGVPALLKRQSLDQDPCFR